jgi:phospholipase C
MRELSGRVAALNVRVALTVALSSLTGCAAGGSGSSVVPPPIHGTPGPPPQSTPPPREVRARIKHVVIVVQENRSFDNFFDGYPGAHTAAFGYLHDGERVRLRPTTLVGTDIAHFWSDGIADWDNGRMDGFNLNKLGTGKEAGTYAYRYVARRYIEPYWSMARQYALADAMFPTMFGGSFTAHLDLIATTTNLHSGEAEVDNPLAMPWGCDAPGGTRTSILSSNRIEGAGAGPFPCFKQFATMADLMDPAGVSWAYYAPAVGGANIGGRVWSEFDSIAAVRYGADWSDDVISPPSTILDDAANGKLRDVSWVIPDWADSDHPASTDHGPSWVASVVNAIGESPYWDSTIVVVLWDDWGGWYDNAAPPQLDFRGLGIRVPCIVISAYAREGYVSHTEYEFGSILQLVEEVFDLPPLASLGFGSGYTDQRAYSITDVFDFKQPPRKFIPIAARYSAAFFRAEKPSARPPDDE